MSDALPMSLPSPPRSVTGPQPQPRSVTGPQPRPVAITAPPLSDADAIRAFRASVAPPSVRPTAPVAPVSLLKAWSDRVPFPVLFVLGALFGVIFATSLVSITKPKPQQVAVIEAAVPAPVDAAKLQQQAQLQAQLAAAAPRTEAAPFVAWAAPPAMPTVGAEPQLPMPAAAPRAPAVRHAKRAVARTNRHGAVANANTLTAAL